MHSIMISGTRIECDLIQVFKKSYLNSIGVFKLMKVLNILTRLFFNKSLIFSTFTCLYIVALLQNYLSLVSDILSVYLLL